MKMRALLGRTVIALLVTESLFYLIAAINTFLHRNVSIRDTWYTIAFTLVIVAGLGFFEDKQFPDLKWDWPIALAVEIGWILFGIFLFPAWREVVFMMWFILVLFIFVSVWAALLRGAKNDPD
jgi:hypothetical protein